MTQIASALIAPCLAICASVVGAQSPRPILTVSGPSGSDFGRSVAMLGDTNGDRVPDFVVGAPKQNGTVNANTVREAGAFTIHSGSDGSILLAVAGTKLFGRLGYRVVAAGDVDKDGRADLIVTEAGDAHVYSGGGKKLYTFLGKLNDSYQNGCAMGDLNGDGYGEFALVRSSTVLVVNGKTGALIASLPAVHNTGSVALAGDVDKDGKADMLVGGACSCRSPGKVIVYSGKDFKVIRSHNGSGSWQLGYSVAGAGDVDLDGYADYAAGRPDIDVSLPNNRGRVVLFSGRTGKEIWLTAARRDLGAQLHAVRDLNGDGVPDLVAGGYGAVVLSGKNGAFLGFLGGAAVGGGADTNGDGVSDLIVGRVGSKPTVQIFTMQSLLIWPPVVQASTGGKVTFDMRFDAAHAGTGYWVFGSVTGTRPGVSLQGVLIPLQPDAYTTFLLAVTYAPGVKDLRGKLKLSTTNTSAVGTATIDVPANLKLPVDLVLYHSAVLFKSSGALVAASYPAALKVLR